MRLVNLIEVWAKDRDWWTFVGNAARDQVMMPYINISVSQHHAHRCHIATIWDDGRLVMQTEDKYTSWNLKPADPDFFLGLEAIIVGNA